MVLLPHFPRSVSHVRLHNMSRIYRLLLVQLFKDLYIPCSWYANVATIVMYVNAMPVLGMTGN